MCCLSCFPDLRIQSKCGIQNNQQPPVNKTLLGLMISPPQGHYYLINSPLERNTQPKGNQVTDIDFQPVNKVLRDRNVQYLELEGDDEREGGERGGRRRCWKGWRSRKKEKCFLMGKPLCHCCTPVPLIILFSVFFSFFFPFCGRHSAQRSSEDNPKAGERCNSANKAQ